MGGKNDIVLPTKKSLANPQKHVKLVRPLHEGQMDVFLPPTNSPWTSWISGEGETHMTEGFFWSATWPPWLLVPFLLPSGYD